MTAHATSQRLSGDTARLPDLKSDELVRFGRHLSLPGVGTKGQEKIKAARVAIVGLGGLGCPAAMYLAAAGVGTLGLIDGDRVDVSNLQRQVLYGDADVGHRKVDVATRRLQQMNPALAVEPYPFALDSRNALDVLPRYDIVLDGTDNYPHQRCDRPVRYPARPRQRPAFRGSGVAVWLSRRTLLSLPVS